jgi:hypothetical protein
MAIVAGNNNPKNISSRDEPVCQCNTGEVYPQYHGDNVPVLMADVLFWLKYQQKP